MGRKTARRLGMLIGGAALFFLGFAAWGFFSGTTRILERAEAFQYRRMTVSRLAEQDAFRFFYVTNRRPASTEGTLEHRFGNERHDGLSLGRFDTKIEPTLGIGMIIDPTDWFRSEEIRILGVTALERAALVQDLRQQVQASPHRALLVLVHGYRSTFPAALRTTAFVGHVLDLDAPVLMFDWPGDQGSMPAGYRRAQRVASASGKELAETLELIIRDVQPERLWVMAHSMGGQVVANGFSVLARQADLSDTETEIEDVVLTAPDVDPAEFDSQFKAEITVLAKNLTVYVSSNDRALLMSRLLNRGRRLGESDLDHDQLDEAVGVLNLTDPDDDLVTLVDVTPVNRTRNFHAFSLETPEFFDDLFLRLTNESTPHSRRIYRMQTLAGSVYWVLTRGR